ELLAARRRTRVPQFRSVRAAATEEGTGVVRRDAAGAGRAGTGPGRRPSLPRLAPRRRGRRAPVGATRLPRLGGTSPRGGGDGGGRESGPPRRGLHRGGRRARRAASVRGASRADRRRSGGLGRGGPGTHSSRASPARRGAPLPRRLPA